VLKVALDDSARGLGNEGARDGERLEEAGLTRWSMVWGQGTLAWRADKGGLKVTLDNSVRRVGKEQGMETAGGGWADTLVRARHAGLGCSSVSGGSTTRLV
jgi:hypothetical protein